MSLSDDHQGVWKFATCDVREGNGKEMNLTKAKKRREGKKEAWLSLLAATLTNMNNAEE